MKIDRITRIDESVVSDFRRLMPQLTGKETYPSFEELEQVIRSEDTCLLVATENEDVIGTLTLVFYHIPTGLKAYIEDVVVDKDARGKGVGKALISYAIQLARKKRALKIDLTSHPARIAANKLYRKMGFTQRESNVYRLSLQETD